MACEFADLHDRAGRMKAVGVVREELQWSRSREPWSRFCFFQLSGRWNRILADWRAPNGLFCHGLGGGVIGGFFEAGSADVSSSLFFRIQDENHE